MRTSSTSSGNSSYSHSDCRTSPRSPPPHPGLPPVPPLVSPVVKPNPYTPAAIPRRCLTLIEKGEYVDFQKLRPKSVDQKTREDGASNISMKFSPTTRTYTLEKAHKESIGTFTAWMEAWNNFVQTRLYFKPDEHFQLFTYQRLIGTLAAQYRFSAVYSYDIDFRNLIATQRRVSPKERTASWGSVQPQLQVIHLTDNQRLPPPKCFKCNESGHTANVCPNQKPKDTQPRQRSPNRNRTDNERSRRDTQDSRPFRNGSKYWYCCDHWNDGQCTRGADGCRFAHLCNKCGATNEHTGPNCNRSTSTGFRPRR